jgi:hypothetical protein
VWATEAPRRLGLRRHIIPPPPVLSEEPEQLL